MAFLFGGAAGCRDKVDKRLNFGKPAYGDTSRTWRNAFVAVGDSDIRKSLQRAAHPKPSRKAPTRNAIRRHFGPFYHGSEFGKIQLDLATGQWYFNDYYESLDPAAQQIAKRYYHKFATGQPLNLAAVTLPAGPPPARKHVPGGGSRVGYDQGSSSFINNVLMSLDRVEYSSRYGGSVRLVFNYSDVPAVSSHPQTAADFLGQAEDFQFEFGKGAYAFDVKKLELAIYVIPDTLAFNPTAFYADYPPQRQFRRVQAEFTPREVTAYERVPISGGSQAAVMFKAVPLDVTGTALREILDGASETVSTAQVVPATSYGTWMWQAPRFVYAFIHSLYQAELGDGTGSDKVTKLLISDDFLDLEARPGIVSFLVYFEIGGLSPWGFGDGPFGEEGIFGLPGTTNKNDIVARSRITHVYNNPEATTYGDYIRETFRTQTYKLEGWESSGNIFGGKWQLNDACADLVSVEWDVKAYEDDVFFDDESIHLSMTVGLSEYDDENAEILCDYLKNSVALNRWGLQRQHEFSMVGGVRHPGIEPLWDWRLLYRVYLQVS